MPSLDGDQRAWFASSVFDGNGLQVEVSLNTDGHIVSVQAQREAHVMAEAVGPAGRSPDDEAVSSFHLPPYYRWQSGPFSCEFTAEWREGAPSAAVSIRHMQSLRRHPRSLVTEGGDGSTLSAIVIGTPSPGSERPAVDWRSWYVVDVEDPFDGPTRRILTTHTRVFDPAE